MINFGEKIDFERFKGIFWRKVYIKLKYSTCIAAFFLRMFQGSDRKGGFTGP